MSSKPPASLKALAESHTTGIGKNTTFKVDPNLITFEAGFNLREDTEDVRKHIEKLYLVMKAGAFIPPVDVSVEDGVIVARDGHCRTTAAKKLRKEMPDYTLECRQLRGNEQDAVFHMLGTGGGSMALTPLEQGKGYLRLIHMGLTAAQIATRLGVSRVTVDNGLTLAEAPVAVQKLIIGGDVSSTVARDAIKNGKEGIAALIASAKANREQGPAKTKSGKTSKKKKVTAKKLAGTAAAKKPAKKKAAAPTAETQTLTGTTQPGLPTVIPPEDVAAFAEWQKTKGQLPKLPEGDEIQVTIKRVEAQEAIGYISANAPAANELLKSFTVTLETALL